MIGMSIFLQHRYSAKEKGMLCCANCLPIDIESKPWMLQLGTHVCLPNGAVHKSEHFIHHHIDIDNDIDIDIDIIESKPMLLQLGTHICLPNGAPHTYGRAYVMFRFVILGPMPTSGQRT